MKDRANQWIGVYMLGTSVMEELIRTEAVVRKCPASKLLWKISQNSKEIAVPEENLWFPLHEKWSFTLRISSVNVTKS